MNALIIYYFVLTTEINRSDDISNRRTSYLQIMNVNVKADTTSGEMDNYNEKNGSNYIY